MAGKPLTRTGKGLYGDLGPPAPKGNRRGQQHGGAVTYLSHAPEIGVKEEQIRTELAAAAPVRSVDGSLPSHDVFAVRMLATAMVRHDNVWGHICEHGLFEDQGLNTILSKLEGTIWRGLDAMGMTPKSRVKLGLALQRSATLADAMNEPNRKKRMKLFRELGVVEGEAVEDD